MEVTSNDGHSQHNSSDNSQHVTTGHSTRVLRKPAWMTDYVDSTTRYRLTYYITYDHVSPKHRSHINAVTESTNPNSF